MFQRRRQQRDNTGVYLLAIQLLNSGPIPPITLGAIILQIAIFLGYIPFLDLDKTRSLCLLPYRIIENGEWHRLIFPIIMHGSDMHLYYNMISLLYKGRKLEQRLGSHKFACILALFSIVSAQVTVAISYLFDFIAGTGFTSQCAVGFSGVLFALKVLMNHYFPYSHSNLFGWLPIPSKYACWAELFLIELVTPNASFVGHLAGILTGLLYTYGPLQLITKLLTDFTVSDTRGRATPSAPPFEEGGSDSYERYGSAFSGRGATTGGHGNRFSQYTGGLSEEDQLRRAYEESLRDMGTRRRYGWNL